MERPNGTIPQRNGERQRLLKRERKRPKVKRTHGKSRQMSPEVFSRQQRLMKYSNGSGGFGDLSGGLQSVAEAPGERAHEREAPSGRWSAPSGGDSESEVVDKALTVNRGTRTALRLLKKGRKAQRLKTCKTKAGLGCRYNGSYIHAN